MSRLLIHSAVFALCLTILLLLCSGMNVSAAPKMPLPPIPAGAGATFTQSITLGPGGTIAASTGAVGAAGGAGAGGGAAAGGGAGGAQVPPPAFVPPAGAHFVIYPQNPESGQAFTLGSYPVGLVPVQALPGNNMNGAGNNNNNNLALLIALGVINQQQQALFGFGGKVGIGGGIGGLAGLYGGY